jgi:hypothetical protein
MRLQPTPLEAFAALPATHIAWSSEIARIDSSEAHASITALILEDTAQPPDRLGGIRIDLQSSDSKDRVYLGEETLAAYKRALDEIGSGVPEWQKELPLKVAPEGTSCFSAQVFWYGDKTPRVHAMTAGHCATPNWSGLSLSTFTHSDFKFPSRDASELSAIFVRAMDELKTQ